MSSDNPPTNYSRRGTLDDLPPELLSVIIKYLVGAVYPKGLPGNAIFGEESLHDICSVRLTCRVLNDAILTHWAIAITNKGIRFLPEELNMVLSLAKNRFVKPYIKRLVFNATLPMKEVVTEYRKVTSRIVDGGDDLRIAIIRYQERFIAHLFMRDNGGQHGRDANLVYRILEAVPNLQSIALVHDETPYFILPDRFGRFLECYVDKAMLPYNDEPQLRIPEMFKNLIKKRMHLVPHLLANLYNDTVDKKHWNKLEPAVCWSALELRSAIKKAHLPNLWHLELPDLRCSFERYVQLKVPLPQLPGIVSLSIRFAAKTSAYIEPTTIPNYLGEFTNVQHLQLHIEDMALYYGFVMDRLSMSPFPRLVSLSISMNNVGYGLRVSRSLEKVLIAQAKNLKIVRISTTDLWCYVNWAMFRSINDHMKLDFFSIQYNSKVSEVGSYAILDLLRHDFSFADRVLVNIHTLDIPNVSFEIWSKERKPKCKVNDVEEFYRDSATWKRDWEEERAVDKKDGVVEGNDSLNA